MSALIVTLNADAGRLTAFRADKHYIRDVNRPFKLDSARVHIATCLRLHLLLMFDANIHTLHNHAAIIKNNVNNLYLRGGR
jgi:hypothetical protein